MSCIRTFRELQEVQKHFEYQNALENTNTRERALALLEVEVCECLDALLTNDPLEIKGELADILIFTATVAELLYFDLQRAINKGDL
jgi:NTP pyrophosphatase (non-canonical NTP hydrolase)